MDLDLARQAAANLADWPWVSIQQSNGTDDLPKDNDVLLVHAGTTHVLDAWLDAVCDGGRILVPLTAAMPSSIPPGATKPSIEAMKRNLPAAVKTAMMANISKGFVLVLTRAGDEWKVRPLPSLPVAIYSMKDVRDESLGAAIGQSMVSGRLLKVTRLRRDRHDVDHACVVHGATTCLAMDC